MSPLARNTLWIAVVVMVACSPAAPQQLAGPAASAPGSTQEVKKTLTVAQTDAKAGFAPWFTSGSGTPFQFDEVHSNFLASATPEGSIEGRVAELPTLQAGTLQVLPDGTMRATWKIRPNVKWHDGTPLTAEDIAFSYQVQGDESLDISQQDVFRTISRVEAIDPQTAVFTHKQIFAGATDLGYRELYLLPKHLLGDSYAQNKEGFQRLPYFSTAYIHLGPFRVTEFAHGERVTMERFDDYFRGRAKLHTIVLRFIGDEQAMMSNILAGEVDATGDLANELVLTLRDRWRADNSGFVLSKPSGLRFISVQFHPQWGGPPELQRDVRIREALMLAMDKDALRETVVPGFADTVADSYMMPDDDRARAVGTPFARLTRYDAARALDLLAQAGWSRAPDGRIINQAGQQVKLDLRATSSFVTVLNAVADNWRSLGLDVTQTEVTRALSRDREYIARFPTMEITGQSSNDRTLARFDSRIQPLAENRYVGNNAGHWVNPRMDSLIDRLQVTLERADQGAILKEAGELWAAELPALPLYKNIETFVGLKHVKAFQDFPGAGRIGTWSRNAHLWDRD